MHAYVMNIIIYVNEHFDDSRQKHIYVANVILLVESHKLLAGRFKVIWDQFALLLEIDEVLSYW